MSTIALKHHHAFNSGLRPAVWWVALQLLFLLTSAGPLFLLPLIGPNLDSPRLAIGIALVIAGLVAVNLLRRFLARELSLSVPGGVATFSINDESQPSGPAPWWVASSLAVSVLTGLAALYAGAHVHHDYGIAAALMIAMSGAVAGGWAWRVGVLVFTERGIPGFWTLIITNTAADALVVTGLWIGARSTGAEPLGSVAIPVFGLAFVIALVAPMVADLFRSSDSHPADVLDDAADAVLERTNAAPTISDHQRAAALVRHWAPWVIGVVAVALIALVIVF